MRAPKRPVSTWTPPSREAPRTNALDERLRCSGRRRIREARPVAPARVREQRELADDERLAADVEERAVEAALVVLEDPQAGDLPGEPLGRFGRVFVPGTDEHEQAAAARADDLAVDRDRGPRHALHDRSHQGFVPARDSVPAVAERIEDYGLIGDLQTAALVSHHGSIDWLCFPRFDSGACFAKLLGDAENGHWSLCPAAEVTAARRRYRGDTLVLETELETDGRHRAPDRLHAAARRGARRRPDRRGRRRDACRMRDGAHDPLRLRLGRPVGAAVGGRASSPSRGRTRSSSTTPVGLVGQNMHTVAEFDGRRRASGSRSC